MDFRLHRNCICDKLGLESSERGLGVRRLLAMGMTIDEIKEKFATKNNTITENVESTAITEIFDDSEIIDARGFYGRNFNSATGNRGFGRRCGAGRAGRGFNKPGRGAGLGSGFGRKF
ncbi:hypothetical protein J2127_001387 [Methanococcus voltae]|uniref:hypothetical protein n=1 Tax=Methanococcus voltae TaxID=2188 RepID=UPI001AE4BFE3|nr:hypothetical protein [Methanococcus voltae]MBP2144217.1 hypothetical protein [Methanococcus voltae]